MSLEFGDSILDEIRAAVSGIDAAEVSRLEAEIMRAGTVFVEGFGRSGLFAETFAMRLMQMGFRVHVVGETTSPALTEGDLLLICSGSAASVSFASHAMTAKRNHAKLALVTANPDADLVRMADVSVIIAAPQKTENAYTGDALPMGSLFEDSAAILFECMTRQLMQLKGETAESMLKRHANLE